MPAKVAIERCDSYQLAGVREAIERALEPLGGMNAFMSPGASVLLKPNYVAWRPPERGAITHPAVIAATAQLVSQCGGKPFVADSPAFGNTPSLAKRSGLFEMYGSELPVRDLRPGQRLATGGAAINSLSISRDVLEADVVINLPKFKAHRQMLMTMSVKNLYGCVPGRRKAWLHLRSRDCRHWFARMLIENYQLVRPALTIMDGIIGMEGQGPANGTPRKLNVVIAGTDCVAIDRVGCEIVGLAWEELYTLKAAADMGVGETDLARIEIAARSIEEFRVSDFEFPRLIPISFSPYRIVKGWLKNTWINMQSQRA